VSVYQETHIIGEWYYLVIVSQYLNVSVIKQTHNPQHTCSIFYIAISAFTSYIKV